MLILFCLTFGQASTLVLSTSELLGWVIIALLGCAPLFVLIALAILTGDLAKVYFEWEQRDSYTSEVEEIGRKKSAQED